MKKYVVHCLLMAGFLPGLLFAQEGKEAKTELLSIIESFTPAQQTQLLEAAKQIQARNQAELEKKNAAPIQVANQEVSLSNAQAGGVSVNQDVPNVKRPAYIEEAESMTQTTVEWQAEMHDFGNITQGDIAKHTFTFKNTGEHPLKITRVKPSCGCTTPSYSTEEVAPGEEGFIEVAFNSKGRSGTQNKAVTVTMNTPTRNKVLRFKGEVVTSSESNDQ